MKPSTVELSSDYSTPTGIGRIMVQILGTPDRKTPERATIYDPACGKGRLLREVAAEAETRGLCPMLYGQELCCADREAAAAAGIEIRQGDTLADPKFKNGRTLKTFDYVVADPPCGSIRQLRGFDPHQDPFKRFEAFDIGDIHRVEYAFFLHILASMKSTGKGACVLPESALSAANDAKTRRAILFHGYIKAIISLPIRLFPGRSIAFCIVVLDKEDANARRGVFMVNAGAEPVAKPGGRLRDGDTLKLMDALDKQLTIPNYSRMVSFDEITAGSYELRPSCYGLMPQASTTGHRPVRQLPAAVPNAALPMHAPQPADARVALTFFLENPETEYDITSPKKRFISCKNASGVVLDPRLTFAQFARLALLEYYSQAPHGGVTLKNGHRSFGYKSAQGIKTDKELDFIFQRGKQDERGRTMDALKDAAKPVESWGIIEVSDKLYRLKAGVTTNIREFYQETFKSQLTPKPEDGNDAKRRVIRMKEVIDRLFGNEAAASVPATPPEPAAGNVASTPAAPKAAAKPIQQAEPQSKIIPGPARKKPATNHKPASGKTTGKAR